MYKFFITYDAETRRIYPIYPNSLAKVYEEESGEKFYRAKLSGSLSIVRADYSFIVDQPIETKFYIEIQRWNGTIYEANYYDGSFYQTDGKVDEDNLSFDINPTTEDGYQKILDAKDIEFNLRDLDIPSTEVEAKVKPIIQIYIKGQDRLTNILGDKYSEKECQIITDENELENTYGFGLSTGSVGGSYFVILRSDTLSYPIEGTYKRKAGENPLFYFREDDVYVLKPYIGNWHLVRVSDDAFLYSGNQGGLSPADHPLFNYENPTPEEINVGEAQIWTRYITNKEGISGAINIPDTDIIQRTANYLYAVPVDTNNYALTVESQVTPTDYGVYPEGCYPEGKYYKEPYVMPPLQIDFFRISWSSWGCFSIWIYPEGTLDYIQTEGLGTITLRANYKLSNVLSAILQEIDPTITHLESPDYSELFYSVVDPTQEKLGLAVDPMGGSYIYPMINQKSNVLLGEFEREADKAIITLKDIIEMYKDTWRAFWHRANDKYIIEHVSWYQNGGSYSGVHVISKDLTTIMNVKSDLPYSFNLNKFSYALEDMPERIQFAWMDRVTEEFEGYPIIIRSEFVNKSLVKDRKLGRFTTDYDYSLSNTSDLSKDGFFLFGIVKRYVDPDTFTGEVLKISDAEINYGGELITLQNSYLSFTYLQKYYHIYDLPAKSIILNNSNFEAVNNISRKKEQVPVWITLQDDEPDIDPMRLVRTGLGDGEVKGIAINLTSRETDINLRHDTE